MFFYWQVFYLQTFLGFQTQIPNIWPQKQFTPERVLFKNIQPSNHQLEQSDYMHRNNIGILVEEDGISKFEHLKIVLR